MESVLRAHQDVQAARPIYEFDLPKELQDLDDPYIKKTVGLRKLTMREELDALSKSGGHSGKAGYYMVMASLAEVDGRAVRRTEAEDETIMNGTDPAIRSLLVDAYTDISAAPKEASETFLKSRRTKIG